MRSITDDSLTGRCPRCWILAKHCLCTYVPRLETRHELLVVRHKQEAWKPTNTARIASLALPRLSFVEFGDDLESVRRTIEPLVAAGDAALVYPAATLSDATCEGARRLVLLDGTWRQTRRMLKKVPALAALPRISLPPTAAPVLRLRQPSFDGARSTLESIADALRVVGDPATAAHLDSLHARYVEHVLRARGRWDAALVTE